MTREKSWPEMRAQALFNRLGLSEILRNDGNIHPKAIHFHKSRQEDSLIQAIPSPDHNLTWTVLKSNGLSLPIKLLTGMDNLITCRLFVLDHEIMSKWDKL